MTEVVAQLSKRYQLAACVKRVSQLPQQLDKPPYLGVLWDGTKQRMDNQGRALARDLLLCKLDEMPRKKIRSVGQCYAKALGLDPDSWGKALRRLQ